MIRFISWVDVRRLGALLAHEGGRYTLKLLGVSIGKNWCVMIGKRVMK